MNIILKSFLLSLAIVIAIVALYVLPEIYGLIILVIFVFFGLWAYLYVLLK